MQLCKQQQVWQSGLWVLRWGVVMLNCSHIVWQLRQWRGDKHPIYLVRNNCIH